MWTEFWDMHSGGSLKEDFHFCYIEAPIDVAKVVFYNRFGHSPDRVTCACCGEDYAVEEYTTLEEATKYHRRHETIEEWIVASSSDPETRALIIHDNEIHPDEKAGTLPWPEQGHDWED